MQTLFNIIDHVENGENFYYSCLKTPCRENTCATDENWKQFEHVMLNIPQISFWRFW